MNNNRYERKFVINNLNLTQILIAIYRSKFFFKNIYVSRKVNSIYFDDVNLSSINENLDGISEKTKIRVRWYGDSQIIKNPILEIKKKREFYVNKETMPLELDNLEFLNSKNLYFLEDYLNNLEFLKKLNLKKKLILVSSTHYKRKYFLSANNLIRATLDDNQMSYSFLSSKYNNIKKKYSDFILELKYSENIDEFVKSNIENFSLRLSKNSKYFKSIMI